MNFIYFSLLSFKSRLCFGGSKKVLLDFKVCILICIIRSFGISFLSFTSIQFRARLASQKLHLRNFELARLSKRRVMKRDTLTIINLDNTLNQDQNSVLITS